MKKLLLVTMLAGSVFAANTVNVSGKGSNHNTKIVNEKDLRCAYSSSNQECLKIDGELKNVLLDRDSKYTVTNVELINNNPKTGKFYQFMVRTSLESLPFSVFSKKGGCLLYKDISLENFNGDSNNPRYHVD